MATYYFTVWFQTHFQIYTGAHGLAHALGKQSIWMKLQPAWLTSCVTACVCVCVRATQGWAVQHHRPRRIGSILEIWQSVWTEMICVCVCVCVYQIKTAEGYRQVIGVRWGSLGTFCVLRFNSFHYQVFIKENESGSVLQMSLNPPHPGFTAWLYVCNLMASILYFYSQLLSFSVIYT